MPKTLRFTREQNIQKDAKDALERMFAGRATISIEEAGQVLEVGKNLAYDMARNGRLPTLLVGKRRRVVPIAALQKYLETAGVA